MSMTGNAMQSAGRPDEGARERMFGAILIDAGRLRPEDAERILREQKDKGLRFGEAALRLGLVKDADIQFALSRQFGYSYLQPGERGVSQELVAAYQPFSRQVEELRALRSQLMLRWFTGEAGHGAIAVAGTQRGEGRSYVAANLAVVFSQLGERTLLIDADLRYPRQHALFRLDDKSGLSAWLAGRAGTEAIQSVPGLARLSVLVAGAVPPNPQELLGRAQFAELLAQLAQAYDVILIDTPAIETGADAQTIAARAGAALLIARKDHSRLPALQGLASMLSDSGAAVVGSVMNDF